MHGGSQQAGPRTWLVPRGGGEPAGVPEDPHPARLQIVRLRHDPPLRARYHLYRRPQRVGQIQRGQRVLLGHGRAGSQDPARRQDGGRRLRRDRVASPAGPGRGHAHHRQQRRRSAHRVRRGDDQPPAVPVRAERVLDQRRPLPPPRRAGTPVRFGPGPGDARHRRPGPAGPGAPRRAGGPPGADRGSGRGAEAPPPQREGAAQARGDAGQPDPAGGPDRGAEAPPQAARPPGGHRPPGRRHPGRPARRPSPAARRRLHDRGRRAGA